MTTTCRLIENKPFCYFLKAKQGKSQYDNGLKYCCRCLCYFRTTIRQCPCCHNTLRMSPRRVVDKNKFKMRMAAKL